MKIVQKAVIKNKDTYLILKRSPHAKTFPEHWDFPGGKLEPNEDPVLGIEREIREETQLDLKAVIVLGSYEFDLLDAGYVTHQYVVYETAGKIHDPVLSDEHTDYRWATKKEMLTLLIEPYMKEYFKEDATTLT